MPNTDSQRNFACSIVEQLRASGHVAYWAGGCVRDQLLGVRPKDYDVATDATPDAIRDLFGRRRTIAVGAAFGVITVLGGRRLDPIEVATFRRDAAYSDGRHPDSVAFSSPEEDAARRDFTINGLFYDPVENRIIDFVGGQEDLKRRIVRAIGDPRERLAEDKLRMLRAVRFTATLSFEIDPATVDAIRDHAHEITTVSAERIGAEIRKMLLDANRAQALELLALVGLLPHVLPELVSESSVPMASGRCKPAGNGGDWQTTLAVCATLESPTLPLALAAALHRVLQPRVASRVGRRLKYTNKEIDRAAWLLAQLPAVAEAEAMPWPRLQRLLIHPGIEELLSLRSAISGPIDAVVVHCRVKLALPPDQLNPRPLITGDDLIVHGQAPGKHFAALLVQVRDAQLVGQIDTKAAALELADRLLEEGHCN